MPTFLIVPKTEDDQNIHAVGTLAETACDIANYRFRLKNSNDKLKAIPAKSAPGTMTILKGDAFCSVSVSRTNQKAWNKDVKEIQNGLDQLDIAINRIEDDLYNALKNLKEKIGESESFNNFLEDDEISIYSTLGGMDLNELEDKFQEHIEDLYALEKLP